jgi:transcriptional regulator with GAF, ATPase, and Fis domain
MRNGRARTRGAPPPTPAPAAPVRRSPYKLMMRQAERQILEHALREANHDVAAAAALIGVDPAFLYRRMRCCEIPPPHRPTKLGRPRTTS